MTEPTDAEIEAVASGVCANIGPHSDDRLPMPDAVAVAAERIRTDAANTMHHSTTASVNTRLMCRVAVKDVGLVMAWLDQHTARAAIRALDSVKGG